MTTLLLAVVGLTAYAAYCLFGLWRRLRATVLVTPWMWAVIAVAGVAATALAEIIGLEPLAAHELRWLSLVLTFCPFVARLGAKRPQQIAWNWVVLSFWVVAGLPAWRALFLDRALFPSAARDSLVIAIVVLQVLDCVGTRLMLPAIIAGAAQILWSPVPRLWPTVALPDVSAPAALLLGVLALSSAFRFLRPELRAVPGWSQLWRQLRDRIGVLWSLRLIQRFNQDAEQLGMEIRLQWRGFVDCHHADGAPRERLPPQVDTLLRNLLRRFADPQWISDRLPDGSAVGPPMVS